MKKNQNAGSEPVAFIAKNKQRVKQYDDIVYLKNGDEFQLELFNPTQRKILAKIELDGKSIGPGIILRPGERVFLERYVNDPRKFKFDTYEVEDNNKQVMEAIKNNGSVNVRFFKEKMDTLFDSGYSNSISVNTTGTWTYTAASKASNVFDSDITFTNFASSSLSSLSSPNDTLDFNSPTVSSTLSYDTNNSTRRRKLSSQVKTPIETGRVEKGSYSDQTFMPDNTKFESTYECVSQWTILPESRKPITADDLVVYCASCGRRRRANENYCPSCGHKF